MYIPFHDPFQALEAAARLAKARRWRFREDRLGRRHVYERQFVPGKDPSLLPEEIVAILCAPVDCRHEHGSHAFFRAEGHVEADDWIGRGRVLFHLDAESEFERPSTLVVVTAFRVAGWRLR